MYAGPLASVIFQKRFPDQKKQGEKKSHCAINRPYQRARISVCLLAALCRTCISLYTFHNICIHMQINFKNQIFFIQIDTKAVNSQHKMLKN